MSRSRPLEELIIPLIGVTEEAAELVMSYWRSPKLHTRQKQDKTPVTEADMAADALFQRVLPQIIPAPVVSEESPIPHAADAGGLWLVDPVDGTQSFAAGSDEFSIVAAYVESGIPVLGVLAAPAKGILYYALKDGGAWKKSQQRVERLPRRTIDPAEPFRIVLSKHPSSMGKMQSMEFINGESKRREGALAAPRNVASALKSGFVAEGLFDLVFHPDAVSLWDLAGAQCVLQEAGCSLLELKTQTPISYDLSRPITVAGYVGFVDGSFPAQTEEAEESPPENES